jgi:hypothetical protein
MAMNSLGLRLWEAYLRAEYWVGFPENRILLQIGDHATGLSRLASEAGGELAHDEPWAYITAWNPGSEVRMDFMNRQKQEDMEMFLRGAGYVLIPGYSRDPSGQWPNEEGVLAFGLGWEKALLLGRRFSQNAILAGMGEEAVQLLRC